MSEEQAVELLNKIKDRSMLTEKEVQMSNELIRRRKIIKKQDELIKDYYETIMEILKYVKENKLYVEQWEYDENNCPYQILTDEDARQDIQSIILKERSDLNEVIKTN